MHVPIPAWSAEGLIPPVDTANPAGVNRAPYFVLLSDVILRFSTTPERIKILKGFMAYRAELHTAGLTSGFQWLNGSFAESIETSSQNRPPKDIDVVTFYRLPEGSSQRSLSAASPALFPVNSAAKDVLRERLSVDAFLFDLGTTGERLVNLTSYWYSLWAHQRVTLKWKGFLQIDLSPNGDAAALQLLNAPRPAPVQ
jgi:hypothetical protein